MATTNGHASKSLDFNDLAPREEPVTIGTTSYVLREASGGAVVAWRNFQIRAARFGGGGKLERVGDIADAEPLLVALCLFPVNDRGEAAKKHVSEDFVRGLPNRVVKVLFERAKEMSDLNEEEAESAEFLEKRIAADQAKLASLRGEKASEDSDSDQGDSLKNVPAATTAG